MIRACGDPRRRGSWIDADIIASYTRLHRMGWVHSVEAWDGDELAGGLYGVAIGGLFAGLAESPGQLILYRGRSFKQYRGMGSVGAIKEGSGDRYQIRENEDPVPEGIEGRVPYKGELRPYLYQITSGLQKGMGYCGCATLDELRQYRKFVKISSAGLRESHAHDVTITQDAPNYSRS